MSKITISVDNTADLGEELLEKYGFERVCMGIVLGEEVKACKDVTQEDVFHAVEVGGKSPKTNAALEIDYADLFDRATADGGSIIHLSLSSNLSASHGNAVRAAKGRERVFVVDTQTLSSGTAHWPLRAHALRESGMSAQEIVNDLTGTKTDASFIINDLKFLYKGGRVTGLKLLGANLLKIRPSLQVDLDGKLVPGKKFKGKFAAAVSDWVAYKMTDVWKDVDKSLAFLMYGDTDADILKNTEQDLRDFGFEEIIVLPIGATMLVHSGRNTVGIAVKMK